MQRNNQALYEQLLEMMNELYIIFKEENKLKNRLQDMKCLYDPKNQQSSIKETVFTLFPSMKPDASLRIHKLLKGDQQQIVVTINPLYRDQIFQMLPSLKRVQQYYETYNKNDFWCHVVCASNSMEKEQRKQLGFNAKDEYKDARNMIRNLHIQISYKTSLLQAKLKNCLSLDQRHLDLLESYKNKSSYHIEGKKDITQPQYPQQYINNPQEFHELVNVKKSHKPLSNCYYSPGPSDDDRYISDRSFILMRQINCFSDKLLECFKQQSNAQINEPKQTTTIDINFLKNQNGREQFTLIENPVRISSFSQNKKPKNVTENVIEQSIEGTETTKVEDNNSVSTVIKLESVIGRPKQKTIGSQTQKTMEKQIKAIKETVPYDETQINYDKGDIQIARKILCFLQDFATFISMRKQFPRECFKLVDEIETVINKFNLKLAKIPKSLEVAIKDTIFCVKELKRSYPI